MYASVPASLNVCDRLWPFGKIPVSNTPLDEVAECGVGPLFTQVTVSPWLIVIVPGPKEKSEIVTDPLAAATAFGWGSGASARSSARNCGAGAGAGSGAGPRSAGAGSAGGGSGGGAACSAGAVSVSAGGAAS